MVFRHRYTYKILTNIRKPGTNYFHKSKLHNNYGHGGLVVLAIALVSTIMITILSRIDIG